MSIKKLFDSNKPSAILVSTNLEEEVVENAPELESADNIREQMERINNFVPQVDFSDPANFARYGSAEQYYEDTLSRIQREFPYDGSEEEITRFHNESTYIDKYIFDSRYPRTTGYAILTSAGWKDSGVAITSDGYGISASPEFISFKGGPHTASGGMPTGKIHQQFTGSNYYDTDIYSSDGTLALGRVGSRGSNLEFDLTKGVTVEFWLNKSQFITSKTAKEVIFDLWNGEASSSAGYGRLTVLATGAADGVEPLRVSFMSGTNGSQYASAVTSQTTASFADASWHHYALSLKNDSGTTYVRTYLDGHKKSTASYSLDIQAVTGSLQARIGSLIASPSGSSAAANAGTLSGSVDEFRFWKTRRTDKQILENYWTQVRGGTNNEIANAELGVYYKFNEGITGTSSTDATVLDYSGRISNGTWTNYPGSSARNTGSAIDSSTSVVSGTLEYKDPIIYDFHPDVKSLRDELILTGSIHDYSTQSSIKDSIPAWAVSDDEENGSGELKKLTQIVGSYFDTLQLQTERLSYLSDTSYDSASTKPLPFASKLLTSRGLAAPEIFVDATLLEYFGNRRSDRKYSMDIHEVKNLIYQNIYNNLTYIYKSKGTEKAFRNLIRCYGIGDDIVKFNAYGNNVVFNLEDTYYNTTTRKNYADFNDTSRFAGIVYQNTSSGNSETTAITYVSGTNSNLASTAEVEVIFPRKFEKSNPAYFETPFLSSSIFGHHVAAADANDFSFPASSADYNFQLYAVRTSIDSKDAYFILKDRKGDFTLTSDVYSNIYDNQKWNFAVRVKDKFWPYSNGITGSGVSGDTVLEWYGVNTEYGVIRNSFELTATSLNNKHITSRRRYYVGADRTESTGSVITQTDIKVTSLRHYLGFLENDVINAHAKDPENIGTLHPTRNIIFMTDSESAADDNAYMPEMASLALHWDFSQVTGSDSGGQFIVEDASSGSTGLQSRYPNATNSSHILANQYAGAGYFPGATSTTKVIDKRHIPTAKQRLPEVINSADAVKVMSQDDEYFPRDAAISQTFFAFEKSMYGIISQEIVDFFATIVEFNNLIGDVVNKYRGGYKDLDILRNLFFEKIQNNPDLDKFIDFYKWIDQSLIIFLQQLVPASANVADEIRVMIEDHILERSKYRHQYPMLDYKGNARWGGDEAKLEARVQSIGELTYNWQYGHAPLDNEQSTSGHWWKERAKRTNTLFNTTTAIASARQNINDIALSFNSASAEKFNTGAGASGIYEGSAYATRRFTNTLRITPSLVEEVKGGYNYAKNQKPDFYRGKIKRGVATALVDVSKGTFVDINVAEVGPPILQEKRKSAERKAQDSLDQSGYSTAKESLTGPFTTFSSSADQLGYRAAFTDTSTDLNGIHFDTYGPDYEIPMQGPFTEAHVGGNRHRHTNLNSGSTLDTITTRPEAYSYTPSSGRVRANDGSFTNPSTSPQYLRDEAAKRPVNVKNIQHTTASAKLGNFAKVYEVVQTSDRNINNSAFVKAGGFSTASITPAESAFVGGLIDYAKPVRARQEHVIVERFSAPGGPEVAGDNQGGSGLDVSSAQFSPYNNINYRNLTVRQPLRTLLTERSEQFGLRSGSAVSAADYTSVTASFHKVNRNPLTRLETGSAGVVTASTFDNYYVQHMIPRSDYQYAWVTASYTTSNANVYGYFPYDGFVSTSAGLVSAVNFIGESDIGSKDSTGSRFTVSYNPTTGPATQKTNFVGLNANIIEPISASDFTLGYPLDADDLNYYNYSNIGSFATNTVNNNSFVTKIGTSAAATAARLHALNHVISHRQGSYGHPTWKQIRVGQTQLPRYYRKNNIYTHTPDGGEIIDVPIAGGTTQIRERYGPTLMVSQSVLTTKFKPITQELQVRTGKNEDGTDQISTVVVESSYGNRLATFDNTDFSNKLNLKTNAGDLSYKQIRNLYANGALTDPSSPVVGVNRVVYSEVVYPSSRNMQTNLVRGRTNYYNNFWRDNREDRYNSSYKTFRNNTGFGYNLGETFDKEYNSTDVALSQSVWVLDGPETFTTNLSSKATGGIDSQNADGYRSGELQNQYVNFVQRAPDTDAGTVDTSLFRNGAIYARKHIVPFKPTPAWQMRDKITIASPISTSPFTSPANELFLLTASTGRGEAVWDAPTLAGRKNDDSTFVTESVNPFYDTYEDYFADIKAAGQSRSIVPEFRISDHLDFYKTRSSDFLADNLELLKIVGTPNPENAAGLSQGLSLNGNSVPQNSNNNDFFVTYTNSDFMKYFEVIRQEHEDLVQPASLKLRCKAVKKFIPYDGFYPAERTVQMSEKFHDAIKDYVSLNGADAGKDAALNTFLKPFMAPGILYNTIKSGIAVDYPIMTGSYNKAMMFEYDSNFGALAAGYRYRSTSSFAIFSNSTKASVAGDSDFTAGGVVSHNEGWDYRVPFEALVEPERYLSGRLIVNDEPSIFAGMNVTASWSGQADNRNYHNMMHNFLASSIDFFLADGSTTKIVSKPQSEWKPITPGQPYGMRIKMYRSLTGNKTITGSWGEFQVPQNISGSDITNFTMYSRPSAFGPPVGVTGSIKVGALLSELTYAFTGANEFSPWNGVYASHTPPYYDGESWVDIIYYTPAPLQVSPPSGSFSVPSPLVPTIEDLFTLARVGTDDSTGLAANVSTTPGRSGRLGSPGTYIRRWRFDQQSLRANEQDSSYHKVGKNYGPMAGPWVNTWAMQGDSSINLFETEEDRWKIQTKFETPMLNFNHLATSEVTQVATADTNANNGVNSVTPRGMWHQFGRVPEEDEGVYIQVTDIPEQWLDNNLSSSIIFDPGGEFDLRNAMDATLGTSDTISVTTELRLKGYKIPIDGADANDLDEAASRNLTTEKPKSLIDICGFETEAVKVGRIREKKRIYEAIVAVPFVEDNGERKFFKLISPRSMLFPGAGESIKRQVELMEKYVFPPGMDFVRNADKVEPMAMYIFEFSHDLSRDDLSHIWQNLPPKIGRQAEYGMATVSHPLLINELLGDPEDAAETLREERDLYHIQYPEKLQWMVFKVKQRAKRDYFKAIGKESASKESVPFYTFNWPYDQFSLVELAQVQADVELGATVPKPKPSVSAANLADKGLLTINPEVSQQKAQGSGLVPSSFTPVSTTTSTDREETPDQGGGLLLPPGSTSGR